MHTSLNIVVTTSSDVNSISLSGEIGLIGPIGCINFVKLSVLSYMGEAVSSAPPV